jgi:CRISPR system Cascade subunit CasE
MPRIVRQAFSLYQFRFDAYEPLTIRGGGKGALRLSVIEFDGVLTVHRPDGFLAKLASGFGRGKAFGLGLMLLRRPPA